MPATVSSGGASCPMGEGSREVHYVSKGVTNQMVTSEIIPWWGEGVILVGKSTAAGGRNSDINELDLHIKEVRRLLTV